MRKSATIKDVAELAGVSIATVSRVINRSSSVKPEPTERVLAAAKKLNYSPNRIARSLKKSHSSSIGYIVSNISDPFFITIGKGIEDYIQEFGYSLIVCSIGHSRTRETAYLKLLQEKKLDGLIINTSGYNDALISELSHQIPIVLSNRRISSSSFWGNVKNNAQNSMQALAE